MENDSQNRQSRNDWLEAEIDYQQSSGYDFAIESGECNYKSGFESDYFFVEEVSAVTPCAVTGDSGTFVRGAFQGSLNQKQRLCCSETVLTVENSPKSDSCKRIEPLASDDQHQIGATKTQNSVSNLASKQKMVGENIEEDKYQTFSEVKPIQNRTRNASKLKKKVGRKPNSVFSEGTRSDVKLKQTLRRMKKDLWEHFNLVTKYRYLNSSKSRKVKGVDKKYLLENSLIKYARDQFNEFEARELPILLGIFMRKLDLSTVKDQLSPFYATYMSSYKTLRQQSECISGLFASFNREKLSNMLQIPQIASILRLYESSFDHDSWSEDERKAFELIMDQLNSLQSSQ